jgi:hypothetical protein
MHMLMNPITYTKTSHVSMINNRIKQHVWITIPTLFLCSASTVSYPGAHACAHIHWTYKSTGVGSHLMRITVSDALHAPTPDHDPGEIRSASVTP